MCHAEALRSQSQARNLSAASAPLREPSSKSCGAVTLSEPGRAFRSWPAFLTHTRPFRRCVRQNTGGRFPRVIIGVAGGLARGEAELRGDAVPSGAGDRGKRPASTRFIRPSWGSRSRVPAARVLANAATAPHAGTSACRRPGRRSRRSSVCRSGIPGRGGSPCRGRLRPQRRFRSPRPG